MRLLLALFRSGFYELWYRRNVHNDRISETDIAFLWSTYANDKRSILFVYGTAPDMTSRDACPNPSIVRNELFI